MVYLALNDVKEEALAVGRKSECRHCGQQITMTRIGDKFNVRMKTYKGVWLHKGEKFDAEAYRLSESNWDHVAAPKYFCMWEINEGPICGKPVKHEDMEAGHFACGTHMRKELERVAEERRVREREQRNREANEIQRFAVEQYTAARARLINIGLDIFNDYVPDSYHDTWSNRGKIAEDKEYKVNRIHKFDVIDFERKLMELLRREMPGDFPSGEDDGEKERLDALADELFS